MGISNCRNFQKLITEEGVKCLKDTTGRKDCLRCTNWQSNSYNDTVAGVRKQLGWRKVNVLVDNEGNLVEGSLVVEGRELSVDEAEKIGKALLQYAIQKAVEQGEDPFED